MKLIQDRGITKPESFKLFESHSNGNPNSLHIAAREMFFDVGNIHFMLYRKNGDGFSGVGFMTISLEEDGAGSRAASALKVLNGWLREYQEEHR